MYTSAPRLRGAVYFQTSVTKQSVGVHHLGVVCSRISSSAEESPATLLYGGGATAVANSRPSLPFRRGFEIGGAERPVVEQVAVVELAQAPVKVLDPALIVQLRLQIGSGKP